MNNNIFRRVEQKYLITKDQYTKLFKNIDKYIEPNEFSKSTVCNIYFDNDNNELIINSISKPVYKLKVRLRSYGIPGLDDEVFLEVKTKFKEIVGKRRKKMSLKEFNDYLINGVYDKNNQIMREIDYFFKAFNLKPSYFVGYDRKSFQEINNPNLRITIDANLRSRTEDLALESGDKGKYYFDEERYIMEIKTLGSIPLWLIKNLSELGIYPVSFSKIGSIYKKDKEECIC